MKKTVCKFFRFIIPCFLVLLILSGYPGTSSADMGFYNLSINNNALMSDIETAVLPLFYFQHITESALKQMDAPGSYRLEDDVLIRDEIDLKYIGDLDKNQDLQWVISCPDEEFELFLKTDDYTIKGNQIDLSEAEFAYEFQYLDFSLRGIWKAEKNISSMEVKLSEGGKLFLPSPVKIMNNFDLIIYSNSEQMVIRGDLTHKTLDKDLLHLKLSGEFKSENLMARGDYTFKFTDRPLFLHEERDYFLNETIFEGYMRTSDIAVEGKLWICYSSVVLEGRAVID